MYRQHSQEFLSNSTKEAMIFFVFRENSFDCSFENHRKFGTSITPVVQTKFLNIRACCLKNCIVFHRNFFSDILKVFCNIVFTWISGSVACTYSLKIE